MCAPGELVELRPEPNNPADPHAIAVFSARGIQLGYLTAERAPWIGGMLKSGREITAIFQEVTDYGAVARAAFDGEQPILPTPKPAVEPEHDNGFWPDPIYDDD